MKKLVLKILLILFIIILIAGGFIIYQGHALYKSVLNEVSLEAKIEKVKQDKTYVLLDNIPNYYKNAVVSVEDRRFYEHGPVDFIAIARAIFTNVRYGEFLQGGSTITQQVAKNLYFIGIDANVMYRKVAEIFMAYDLEKNYSKDDILELYINTIYFGDGYYGIEEACNGYLDKNSNDMTLYEATMMAGIPNAPSLYAPTANLALTLSRQKKVVTTMVENEYLTQEEADKILNMQPKNMQ